MSPTPDERRASWVEPGIARRVEDGEVQSVAIDLRRVHAYGSNGMTFLDETPDGGPRLILSPDAIRRLARVVGAPR
jgi:hypothetical protein